MKGPHLSQIRWLSSWVSPKQGLDETWVQVVYLGARKQSEGVGRVRQGKGEKLTSGVEATGYCPRQRGTIILGTSEEPGQGGLGHACTDSFLLILT